MTNDTASEWLMEICQKGGINPACVVVVPGNDTELADYYRSVDILIAPGTVQHGAPHYPVMEAWHVECPS